MRKIFINESQNKMLQEAAMLHNIAEKIPVALFDDIKMGNTPLSDNDVIVNKNILTQLTIEGFKLSCENFRDDITQYKPSEIFSKLSKLIKICQAKERDLRPQLERLCYNTIVEMFNIPDDIVDMHFHIEDKINPSQSFHIKPDTEETEEFDDIQSIKNKDREIMKRKCINVLLMGASMELCNAGLKHCLNELFDLDEELPHIYSQILKINNYLTFVSKMEINDKNHLQAGYEEVILGDDITNAQMHAYGIIFPILLQESIKGMLEICASNGLPDDTEYAKKVIDVSDVLRDEPWCMRLGNVLWAKMMSSVGTDYDSEIIPELIRVIATMDEKTFFDVMPEIIASTKQGKTLMQQLFSKAEHDTKYNKFQDDLMKRQEDSDIIEDSYFNDKEISLWENYLEDYE